MLSFFSNAQRRQSFLWTLLVSCLLFGGLPNSAAARLELGANANESCSLERQLLDRSRTPWVRGFVPAAEFISGRRNLGSDLQLRTLKAAADSGRKLILSIKWDLKAAGWRVPSPGSPEESKWIGWVDQLLSEMGGRTTILVISNEVLIDTMQEDLAATSNKDIPIVHFLQNLAGHLRARGVRSSNGSPLPIYVGGLTRLDRPAMQNSPAVQDLLRWAAASDQVTGLDVHLHVPDFQHMEQALQYVRARVPSKPVIVTEFSPIWNYKNHLGDSLDVDEPGRRFAQQFGLDPGLRVVDYINRALVRPVPESEWQAFLASRAWFDPLFLTKAGRLMERYGVTVASYAFAQTRGCAAPEDKPHRPLTLDSAPWLLNPLFVKLVARSSAAGTDPVNYGVFDDYVHWQQGTAPASVAIEPARIKTGKPQPPPPNFGRPRALPARP